MFFFVLEECGGGFTSKLEGMFKDMELSKDIMLAFKQVGHFITHLGEEKCHNSYIYMQPRNSYYIVSATTHFVAYFTSVN